MPDKNGRFGIFGGRYVPDTLFEALSALEKAYHKAIKDKAFKKELHDYLTHYVGRPTPLTYAASLSKVLSLNIYLKREDLNHTGAHKINNALAQVLLAKKWVKPELLQKQVLASMGWLRPQPQRYWGCPVIFTWVKKTCKDSL